MSIRALKEAETNQRIAADPTASVFVTANAGSGKTKVLVDRIARLLLTGAKPSAFLCITYTKAAAAEMQRRLFERLGEWCVADDATLAADLDKLGAGEPNLRIARALFAQALETPGGLRIQTIHAFCERLLARFPIEAGAPPGFDIADEARSAVLLAQARAEAALDDDHVIAAAFQRFAARMGGDALDRLFDRLALRRVDFHRFAARNGDGAFAEAAIRNRHGVRQGSDVFANAFLAQHDWGELEAALETLEGSTKQDQVSGKRLRSVIESRRDGAAALHTLRACFDFAFTSDDEPYKRIVTVGLARKHPWVEELLNNFSDAIVDARGRHNAIERAEDAVAALRLALKLDLAYEAAKARAGALDFDDLIEHAQRLLRQSEAASWVLYKLDGGFEHILIDEGQDTSPLQWDLIAPLQEEFFAGRGAQARRRTIFAVGDPKQSIYAFQGADPDRFLEEAWRLSKRAHRGGFVFKAPRLETSFRSSPEILRVVDAVFADKELVSSAPSRHDEARHLAARERESGAVEVWPLAPRPVVQDASPWDAPMDVETGASVHAILARAIAKRIKAMIEAREAVWDQDGHVLRPMQAGDVLALVRTRGPLFRELVKSFKRVGLPVAGADRMVLRDELVVEDCLALMRVALDPADDLAVACVLKGPWCNLVNDDEEIFPLAHGRAPGETLHSRLMAASSERHEGARAFVVELMQRSGAGPFEFLSWALETRHGGGATGWERVLARLGAESRDPLEELLQRALKLPHYSAPSLQRFLADIELDAGQVKRELESETNAIRVMTVHGAKGLEAPLVILPDTTAPPADKPDDGLIFDDETGPHISFRESDDDGVVSAARASHKAHMLGEHWRLLYVAMTRARDRLIVCGAQHGNTKTGEAEASWRLAVETVMSRLGAVACETPFGAGLRYGAPNVSPVETRPAPRVSPLPAWAKEKALGAAAVELAAPSRIARFEPALFSPLGDGNRRFRRGRIIHQLLERLPDISSDRREASAMAWLSRQGVALDEARVFAREAMSVIDDVRFAPAFGPSSRAEAPIVGEAAGKAVRGVVDRLAVDNERVMVIDFKTDRPAPIDADGAPEPYVLQLALYREVLRSIFPGKRVSCALLWTEAPHLMELPDTRLTAAFEAFARG